MDFFDRQHTARKRTGWFLVLFTIAVFMILAAVHAVVAGVIQRHALRDPKWIAIDCGATLFIILCGVLWTRSDYSEGGSAVAEACGGRLVPPDSRDPAERRLLNVVEEMAIASGVPTPAVYLMEYESGINAFAAGRTNSDAVVAVTQGALDQLTRAELQGVIGHEFSHILNGDMRLNLTLAGWLGGILGLSVVGELLVRIIGSNVSDFRPRRGGGSSGLGIALAAFAIGAGLWLVGSIGIFFARAIQAAVSRQREFLADASSVQFTRNPVALAGALKKIAGFSRGSILRRPHASMLRHMFFANACKQSWLDSMLATHPPIEERIQWLDPSFNPEMAQYPSTAPAARAGEEDDNDTDLAPGIAALAGTPRQSQPLINQVGSPARGDLDRAKNLVLNLPAPLLAATRDRHGACAVVYALLLADNDALRQQQRDHLRQMAGEPVNTDLDQIESQVRALEAGQRLPVAILALSGLRAMGSRESEEFNTALNWLIASDGFLDLFEFTLQRVLRRHLDASRGRPAGSLNRYNQIDDLQTECVILLSCLAHQGQPDEEAGAAAAYRAGLRLLALSGAPEQPLPQDLCKLDALGTALDKMAAASFALKKKILAACETTVQADGQISTEETELLRAISDTLGCPVPPR